MEDQLQECLLFIKYWIEQEKSLSVEEQKSLITMEDRVRNIDYYITNNLQDHAKIALTQIRSMAHPFRYKDKYSYDFCSQW